MNSNFVILPDLAATQKLAAWLAPFLRRGDMLALQGSLGAGKTAFARGMLRALGVTGEIPSPTFTLIQTYDTKNLLVHHFDLYRLKNPMELDELGWDDALAEGAVIAEWPERTGNRLPEDHLTLYLTIHENGQRTARLEPHGTWITRLKEIP